ncbi:response regulator transcription factor [Aquirufa ecclesiirivi]
MSSHITIVDFTLRELEVISQIQQGNTSQEIAEKLNLSQFTIKKHRENIARKIGSHGKKEFRRFIRNFKT